MSALEAAVAESQQELIDGFQGAASPATAGGAAEADPDDDEGEDLVDGDDSTESDDSDTAGDGVEDDGEGTALPDSAADDEEIEGEEGGDAQAAAAADDATPAEKKPKEPRDRLRKQVEAEVTKTLTEKFQAQTQAAVDKALQARDAALAAQQKAEEDLASRNKVTAELRDFMKRALGSKEDYRRVKADAMNDRSPTAKASRATLQRWDSNRQVFGLYRDAAHISIAERNKATVAKALDGIPLQKEVLDSGDMTQIARHIFVVGQALADYEAAPKLAALEKENGRLKAELRRFKAGAGSNGRTPPNGGRTAASARQSERDPYSAFYADDGFPDQEKLSKLLAGDEDTLALARRTR